MKIAFYAPMRPPGAQGTSGDRAIATLLWSGLEALGHHVFLASPLKTWSAAPPDFAPLNARAETDAVRLLTRGLDLFFTYHSYYKAPDLIGPALAHRSIPYVIAEASLAPRRATGPWAAGFAAAKRSIDTANAILSITARDRPALEAAGYGDKLINVPLYSQLPPMPPASGEPHDLITVAMMREGDKLESYRILARALQDAPGDWHLTIVGDGHARGEVETLFAPLKGRVTFKGALMGADLAGALAKAGTFVWPGTQEGLGIAFLEAQAAGLPCVALDEPGPRAAIAGAGLLCQREDLAEALSGLLAHESEWLGLKEAAIQRAQTVNTREQFLAVLGQTIERAAA